MIADPDPYAATMNALQLFRVDDVVISTLPATRSGWMRADLIERVRRASGKPVPLQHARASGQIIQRAKFVLQGLHRLDEPLVTACAALVGLALLMAPTRKES